MKCSYENKQRDKVVSFTAAIKSIKMGNGWLVNLTPFNCFGKMFRKSSVNVN